MCSRGGVVKMSFSRDNGYGQTVRQTDRTRYREAKVVAQVWAVANLISSLMCLEFETFVFGVVTKHLRLWLS